MVKLRARYPPEIPNTTSRYCIEKNVPIVFIWTCLKCFSTPPPECISSIFTSTDEWAAHSDGLTSGHLWSAASITWENKPVLGPLGADGRLWCADNLKGQADMQEEGTALFYVFSHWSMGQHHWSVVVSARPAHHLTTCTSPAICTSIPPYTPGVTTCGQLHIARVSLECVQCSTSAPCFKNVKYACLDRYFCIFPHNCLGNRCKAYSIINNSTVWNCNKDRWVEWASMCLAAFGLTK